MIIVSMFVIPTFGQDIHFSQYYHAFPLTNPALTGVFNGDIRLSGVYRSQWNSVPVNYQTYQMFGDFKIMNKKKGSKNFAGIGAVLDYDRAGDSRLSLASLGVSGSYTIGLSDNVLVTLGGMLTGSQRGFNTNDLQANAILDNEGNIINIQDLAESGDNISRTSFMFIDIASGVNVRLQKSNRTKVDIGLGAFHLATPEQSFNEFQDVKLDRRFALHALGSLQLTESLDLLLRGLTQFQGPYRETVLDAMGKIYLNSNFGRELALSVGAGYRLNPDFGDAIFPKIQLDYRTLTVGVSYDVNLADFDIATDGKGGPEISVVYLIRKVKALDDFKNCPIY